MVIFGNNRRYSPPKYAYCLCLSPQSLGLCNFTMNLFECRSSIKYITALDHLAYAIGVARSMTWRRDTGRLYTTLTIGDFERLDLTWVSRQLPFAGTTGLWGVSRPDLSSNCRTGWGVRIKPSHQAA
jgi:hypothetical protein